MTPKLRQDCAYIATDDGVEIVTTGGPVWIRGEHAFALLDRLAPLLDGSRSLDELTLGMPAQQEALLRDFVQVLADRGLVHDTAAELPHTLAAWEQERYADQIAYLDAAAGSGAHRFQRFRDQRALVIGSGHVLLGTLNVLGQLGIRETSLTLTPEAGTDHEALDAIVAGRAAVDPDQRVVPLTGPADWAAAASVRAMLTGHQLILHATDRPMLGRATALSRAAAVAGVPLLQAVVVDGHAWIGPAAGGCWECGWLRRTGTLGGDQPELDAHRLVDRPDAEPEEFLSAPLGALIGGCLALAAFELVTIGGRADGPALTELRLETAETSRHDYLPHPRCGTCSAPTEPSEGDFRVQLKRLQTGPPVPAAEFSRQAARLVERRTGVIATLDETGLTQLPLGAGRASVADPAAGGALGSVLAVAEGFEPARRRTAVAAIELAASRTVDERRLPAAGTEAWAVDLVTDQPELVPASLLHPTGRADAAARRAVALGASWPEAVGRALLRLCHSLNPPVPDRGRRLDLAVVARVDQLRLLIAAARQFDADPQLVDASGPLPVATVATAGTGMPPGSASALTLEDATRTALEAAVAQLQGLAPTGWTIPPDVGDERWHDALPGLLEALSGQGWRALATPLDHDRAVAELHPYLAAVALVPAS